MEVRAMPNNLIIYYSRAGENYVNGSVQVLKKGNTEVAAGYIRKAVAGWAGKHIG